MFIETHILQNFAPSNLNRDDTGAPKDCEFGGVRRARISSQCIKRSIRNYFKKNMDDLNFTPEDLAKRTKRLVGEIVSELVAKGKDEETARSVTEALLGGIGISVKEDDKTQYLLFFGQREINSIADICLEHWDKLSGISKTGKTEEKDKKKKKQQAKGQIPREITKQMETMLTGGGAADLALFGRMLADKPERNIDAASQVAHAISTNRMTLEFDFFTAIDDLKDPGVEDEEGAGAGMMGTVEFDSACFYRYSNIDLKQLLQNLQGDKELMKKAVSAFLKASICAVPTGKQNSFAAQNAPDFVLCILRKGGPLFNLSNAFEKPVLPGADKGLLEKSIAALDDYFGRISSSYGSDEIIVKAAIKVQDKPGLPNLGINPISAGALVKSVVEKI